MKDVRVSEIQSVVTKQVYDYLMNEYKNHIKYGHEGNFGYTFNIHKNFFIKKIIREWQGLKIVLQNKTVVIGIPDTYEDFIQSLFVVYHENFKERTLNEEQYIKEQLKETENTYPTIKARDGQSYECRNCGKAFSKDMNFRVDGFGRNICPICERRTISIVNCEVDDFYD